MALVSGGCTPALNWRDVSVERLKVNLPCKPDRAQRPVVLLNTTLQLDMAGCEAADALFAVSHATVPQGVNVKDMLAAWQTATLENMQVQKPAEALAAYQAIQAATPPATIAQAQPLHAKGINPQGGAVQASLVWFAAGSDIYHLAVYAPALKPEMVEPLITQALIQ